ncbi:MAG: HD-GYP domain-containing protein [Phycisphaerae bacterium]|nr:HD-GYP domain-containing protein [Phycisphaerae bacterium]
MTYGLSGLSPSQRDELTRFGTRVNRLGANFAVCSSSGKILLLCEGAGFKSSRQRLMERSCQILADHVRSENTENLKQSPVQRYKDVTTILAGILPLSPNDTVSVSTPAVALLDLGDNTAAMGRQAWSTGGSQGASKRLFLSEMLAMLIDGFRAVTRVERQMDQIGLELSKVYEELVLLHRLSTRMKVTEPDAGFLQMACDSLTEVVDVEGIAIVLEKLIDEERQLTVSAGSGLIDLDSHISGMVYSRLLEEMDQGRDALVDSQAYNGFRYEWPTSVRNVIAVPLMGKDCGDSHFMHRSEAANHVIGFMVAVNIQEKDEFDSVSVKLFNSVASGCAVFVENGRLFHDLSELFIGSLKTLTDSIDAKDGYTHGHSERVAMIARWIGECLVVEGMLRPEQVSEVYLAGLLHDIGKIGVDDAVLRKTGPLTEEESESIKKHPVIGAGILRGIKQMGDIVPGVMSHHENVDGSGYPSGLLGDDIPIIGKIVGLADSFDAMTSKRSYREARSIDQAVQEIRTCVGSQFDEKVVNAFLNSDLAKLWEIMQYGSADIHHTSSMMNTASQF